MSTTNTAELKQSFVKWANDNGFSTRLREDEASPDTFFSYETEQRWIVWKSAYQAGRSAAHGEQSKDSDSNVQKVNIAQAGSAEPISDGDREFITKRLRRVAKIVGLESAIPEGDDLIECAGSVLGMIASTLERAGSAEQVSELPQEVYTVRDWIEAAWCAGYYHAGYTHDSAYSQHQAKEFADHALAGLAALSAPERKVTDEKIAELCHRKLGILCGKNVLDFARAILNQQGEKAAPEAKVLVDVATAVMDEFSLLNQLDDLGTQSFCEALYEAFNRAAAPSTAQKEESNG
jgi:hypothetical protein